MSSFKIITIQCAERDMLPTTHLGPIDHDCVRLMDLCHTSCVSADGTLHLKMTKSKFISR